MALFVCSLSKEEQACSLYAVRVRLYPGIGLEGWLGYFAHPLGTVVCRGHAQYPAFSSSTFFFFFLLQTLQKWQLGFLVPLYLLGSEFATTAS